MKYGAKARRNERVHDTPALGTAIATAQLEENKNKKKKKTGGLISMEANRARALEVMEVHAFT